MKNFLGQLKREVLGTPKLMRTADGFRLTAKHRLPSSGDEEQTAFRFLGLGGAAAILVAHYRPDVAPDVNTNVFIEFGNTVVAGLANAVGRLIAIADAQSLDVPLDSLSGWAAALAFLGGVTVFRHSGLFDLYTFLTNREAVRVDVDSAHLTVRRGTFGLPRRIARATVEDVLIHSNHRTGHDVMLQHDGDLTRLASMHGDLTRPTVFRLKLKEAMATVRA